MADGRDPGLQTTALVPAATTQLRPLKTRVEDFDDDDFAFVARVFGGTTPARVRSSIGLLTGCAAVGVGLLVGGSSDPLVIGAMIVLAGATVVVTARAAGDIERDLIDAGFTREIARAAIAGARSWRMLRFQFTRKVPRGLIQSREEHVAVGRALFDLVIKP